MYEQLPAHHCQSDLQIPWLTLLYCVPYFDGLILIFIPSPSNSSDEGEGFF